MLRLKQFFGQLPFPIPKLPILIISKLYLPPKDFLRPVYADRCALAAIVIEAILK